MLTGLMGIRLGLGSQGMVIFSMLGSRPAPSLNIAVC